ncbi:MAG: general secretion pathway protein GspB [Rhizobacter sp.]
MSYILDALRKADAERERGSVPGLHTQPLAVTGADAPAPRGAPSPLLWGAGAFIVLAVVIAWVVSGSLELREPAGAVATTVATAPAVAPPPAPAAALPAPAPASPSITAAAPPPIVVPKEASPRPGAAKPAATASEPAADTRIHALNELPENIRREMPPLTIGGSIYSDTPASRFLIINGRIFHEGDKITSNLSLEQIKLKAAVLRFKGYRVGITY